MQPKEEPYATISKFPMVKVPPVKPKEYAERLEGVLDEYQGLESSQVRIKARLGFLASAVEILVSVLEASNGTGQ